MAHFAEFKVGLEGFTGSIYNRKLTTFMRYSFTENAWTFERHVPTRDCNSWDYCEETGMLACFGCDDHKLTLLHAPSGELKLSIKIRGDYFVRLTRDRILLAGRNIQELDYAGNKISSTSITGNVFRFTGTHLLTTDRMERRYNIHTYAAGDVSKLTYIRKAGVGVTSFATGSQCLAVTQGGASVSVFGLDGTLLWESASPDAPAYHPIDVACHPSGDVYTVHRGLGDRQDAILTVHDLAGNLKASEQVEFCPSNGGFVPDLSGWLCYNLKLLEFRDFKLHRRFLGGGEAFLEGLKTPEGA